MDLEDRGNHERERETRHTHTHAVPAEHGRCSKVKQVTALSLTSEGVKTQKHRKRDSRRLHVVGYFILSDKQRQ